MKWANRSTDGYREYRSADGQWKIVNPTPWRTMGGYKNWHLARIGNAIDQYAGSYRTMREAKAAAALHTASQAAST